MSEESNTLDQHEGCGALVSIVAGAALIIYVLSVLAC